ncbi:acyltransferase family protein, partial [Vibrio splendidus]|uniref:acyltransferase family protein n=1 Tax=Vibrio splendidus TaxID=29497 RepID=UPI0039A48E54
YIAYFCFGGFLGKYNSFDNNKIFVVLFFSSLLITVIGSYYFTYYYFYSYLSFNVVLMSISVFILSRNNLNCKFFFSKYAQFSFGVYLIHPIFLDVINFAIKDLLLLYMNAYVYVPTVSFVVMVLSLNTIRVIFGNKHLYKYV